MRTLLGIALLALLFGCSADRDPLQERQLGRAQVEGVDSHPLKSRRASASFASLPDRGDLLDYDRVRLARQVGPNTWHPVELSETHALRAIVDGEMTVTAPNGTPVRLRYERHVEHPDGNWTWIGHDANGHDAVITFGEKAVFGSLPYGPGRELRLATTGSNAWMVENNPSLPQYRDGLTRPSGEPDYLVPPKLAAALAAGKRMTSASMRAESDTPVVAVTIDVVLGYSSGFTTEMGGQSQAVTRLNNLVDKTNQAYARSLIVSRIRLVNTIQVTYADNTTNESALEQLTGDDGSGQFNVPVPASLNSLRTLGEQSGADLVSLVRNFQAPENEGCGIAWLLGGGGLPIEPIDAPYAYSIVSAHQVGGSDYDETDGNSYFCREETLAHELGHNAGQAHNSDDSSGPGTHPYSYGYREVSATGFYTIMAYGSGSSQFSIPYFANPNVSYDPDGAGGMPPRPTGVVNASDNTRSLNQVMSIIAAFRTAVRARNDVDGDGKSDLLWFHPTNRVLAYWVMNGVTRVRSSSQVVASGYSPLTSGDYNGDGRVDVVMRNGTTMQMWLGNGNAFGVQAFRAYPGGWNLVASADIDADKRSDLLWFNPTTSQLAYWVLNGTTLVRSSALAVASGYSPLTTGDYNGDGRIDILWRHTSGALQLWTGNGNSFTTAAAGTFPAGWTSIGSGDVNADGKSDLLWYHPTQQKFAYWLRNGATTTASGAQLVPAGYTPLANGDFNGDRQIDLDWKPASGAMLFWLRSGSTYVAQTGLSYPAGWSIINGAQ